MRICYLDIETTGTDIFFDDILEIGAFLVDDHTGCTREFSSFINPFTKIESSKEAAQIHGISADTIANAPTELHVLNKFFETVGSNYCFCGWNIHFDVTFFRKMCRRNNLIEEFNKINYRHIDLQSIKFFAKQLGLLPEGLDSLTDLCIYFDLPRKRRHSAFQDAKIAYIIHQKLLRIFGNTLNEK